MSGICNIEMKAVVEHGRERLYEVSKIPGFAGEPRALSAAEYPGSLRAFRLDRLMSTIGRAALRLGYGALGLRASVAAAAANAGSAKANIAAAVAYRRANEFQSALLYARRAAARDDATKKGNWELGKLLLRIMRDASAQEMRSELLDALREASGSSDRAVREAALLALSNALHDSGEYAEAEAAAGTVLSALRDERRALRARANSLVPQSRFLEAADLYGRLARQEPGNAEVARKLRLLTRLAEEGPPALFSSASSPSPAKQPLLIGVGSGIGDMLHATPMIRNIARRTGSPVEIAVAADHPHAEFLMANPRYVSRVWPISRAVLERDYDTVFLTQFFGALRFAFRGDRIISSSQWRKFRPGMLNDTLLNLEAAKHLLGVAYDEADAQHYFAGDLVWTAPADILVGLHAGSKSDRWLSKRWPRWAELATRLSASGIRVASFGTPDEYVPGTENRTGGTIGEMARAMLACSHFVSNDSGPMHIANALGMPVLAVYAPTDALSHLPMRASTAALALSKPCSPCEVKDHPYFVSGACRCIAEIPADAVEAKVLEMLARGAAAVSDEAAAAVPEGA